MKEKRNKQWREYDEEGYAAKYLLTYLQSCFPYCCGWMPYYHEFEPKKYLGDTHFNKHSDKTKDKK
jgi:hypothetical protein